MESPLYRIAETDRMHGEAFNVKSFGVDYSVQGFDSTPEDLVTRKRYYRAGSCSGDEGDERAAVMRPSVGSLPMGRTVRLP